MKTRSLEPVYTIQTNVSLSRYSALIAGYSLVYCCMGFMAFGFFNLVFTAFSSLSLSMYAPFHPSTALWMLGGILPLSVIFWRAAGCNKEGCSVNQLKNAAKNHKLTNSIIIATGALIVISIALAIIIYPHTWPVTRMFEITLGASMMLLGGIIAACYY